MAMISELPTVLVLSHGHPALQPGGGENAAYALHQAIQATGQFKSVFLAAASQSYFDDGQELRPFVTSPAQQDASEWLLKSTSDWLTYQTACSLHDGSALHQFIQKINPTILNVHQIMHVGIDLVLQLRHWCPNIRIVYTLHEFLLQCPFNGQLKTRAGSYCSGPTESGCRECLPMISFKQHFFRAERIGLLCDVVDHYVSPSHVVRDRFVEWGIADNDITVVPNLLPESLSVVPTFSKRSTPLNHVFGFFGNCAEPKGLDLIMEALLALLPSYPNARLIVHGPAQRVIDAGLPRRDPYALRLQQLIADLGPNLTLSGAYQQSELPQLMARIGWVVMASRWLENSPVVIQEALACRRPLLVPAMGGMAEHVRNGFDGLHFLPESVPSLRETMAIACGKTGLWDQLQSSLAKPFGSRQALDGYLEVFQSV